MSASVSHLTDDLILSSVPSQTQLVKYGAPPRSENRSKEALQALFVSLRPPLDEEHISDAIQVLQDYESNRLEGRIEAKVAPDAEEIALRDAILGRLVAGIYAEALDKFLNEAIDVEAEAEWWADVTHSRLNVGYYLLQTLPLRLVNLTQSMLRVLRSQNRRFTPSLLTISSVRNILSEKNTGHSNTLAASLFPHLRTHPHLFPISFSRLSLPNPFSIQSSTLRPSASHLLACIHQFQRGFSNMLNSLLSFITLPLELTRQECNLKRTELERVRDARAESLGELTAMRSGLADLLRANSGEGAAPQRDFLQDVNRIISGNAEDDMTEIGPPPSLLEALTITSAHVLPKHSYQHITHLRVNSLLRPSRFTQIWPRLVVLPPLTLFLVREVYASQDTLIELGHDAWETLKGFWRGWLVDPIADIVNTVRTGGDEGMIVQKESIAADLQSLERMALSLARDKLGYGPAQLDELSLKLRLGDLTPILHIYEEDIKSPVRSAVGGTLLRSLFVQVQKAKVDIDQTLSGIDKLLKSQELTFAFVGVAPALAILYISGGYLRGLWAGGRGVGRFGGRKRRTAAWLAMRRVERLLVAQPQRSRGARQEIAPLTAGLLLLSVSALRRYAEASLPAHSRLREGFLEDVGDLEDPALDRDEKVLVVHRMWRSWGGVLGWEKGGEGSSLLGNR